MDHNAMAAARDQVRYQVSLALRTGWRALEPSDVTIARQTDEIMSLLGRICTDTDTYHLLIGYLNTIRLRAQEAEGRHGEPSITEA